MVGEILGGKYKLGLLLGKGGMGAVYAAEHTGTGRRVAVKVISAEVVTNKAVLRRFEIEARAAGRVESQHIAQVLDVGVDEATNAPFLAIEYLEGSDVSALVAKLGPLEPTLALRIVAQACRGLERAHAKSILHRDIKPANLFLTHTDDDVHLVKILDFGVAKLIDDEDQNGRSAITSTGAIIGSPLYMSPEQSMGGSTLDQRTDVWSLGIVLWETLTGSTPFDRCATVGALLVAIATKALPSIRGRAPWVSPEVASLVERALRKDPSERYGNVTELLAAIRTCLPGGLTIHTSELVPFSPPAAAAPAAKPTPRLSGQIDTLAMAPTAMDSHTPAVEATLASDAPSISANNVAQVETSAGVVSSQAEMHAIVQRRSTARKWLVAGFVLLLGSVATGMLLTRSSDRREQSRDNASAGQTAAAGATTTASIGALPRIASAPLPDAQPSAVSDASGSTNSPSLRSASASVKPATTHKPPKLVRPDDPLATP